MGILNMRAVVFICALLALAALVSACPKWTLYKQCDSSWGNKKLGTSSSQTICSAGCAMSSVAMALASYDEKINGDLVNPGNLNSWLNSNGGYEDSDLIVWSSVDKLGKVTFKEEVGSLSTSDLGKYVSDCYPVIANVRSGTHWVLITGATSSSQTWEVNDPGFSSTTYSYSDMSEFVVYTTSGGKSAFKRYVQAADHQNGEALLSDAQNF